LNESLRTPESEELIKDFLSEGKLSLFGYLQPTYEFCKAYAPKILEYLEAFLSSPLPELNQPVKLKLDSPLAKVVGKEEVEVPLWEALEREEIRLRPKGSNPTTGYFLEIIPDTAPKYLNKDGYAIVAEIGLDGLKVYDKELAIKTFKIIEEVSGNSFWSRVRKEVEEGRIPEVDYYSPLLPGDHREGVYGEEIKIPRWAKILAGIGVLAIVGGWAFKLYVDHKMREERIKPLLSIGYSRSEAMDFDYRYNHWAIDNQYNSSVLEFAKNLKSYPETSLALLQHTNSLQKINRSFDSLLPYFHNKTFSDEQIASFTDSYPFLVKDDGINQTDISAIKYWIKFPDLFDKVVKNCPVLLSQSNLMNGDFDKDGFTNHEEVLLGFNPINPQERIFLPVKNDTIIIEYIPKFYEYKNTGIKTVLSSTQLKNFRTIVNGTLGYDPKFETLGLNRSEIARIYRINTIASGYLHLNSSWPLKMIDLERYCLKTHGKFEPSNDLTLGDVIIQQYIASHKPNLLKEDPWRFMSITDCLGWWAFPSFSHPVYYFDDNLIMENMTAFKELNAFCDGKLNETNYKPSLNSWERVNLLPTFEFFWKKLPKGEEDRANLYCYTTSLGYIEFGTEFPPYEPPTGILNYISALNRTVESPWGESTKIGLITAEKIFDSINSTKPEMLYDYHGPRKFVKDHLNLSVSGCQFVSSFNLKIYTSKGFPAINFYQLMEEPDGSLWGHHSTIIKFGDTFVYQPKRIAVDSNQPYWIDVEKSKQIFSAWGDELKKIYVLDISRERSPIILLYKS